MASIKQKSKDNKGLIVHTLVVRKLNRNVLDVGQWRTALKAADNDKRQKLYDLYEDIMLDTVLSKAVEKRINAITNAELNFMKDEKPVPEMDDLIGSPVMEEILTEIMNSRFWGKTVLELDFTDGLQVYNIPRQHIRPEKGIITINPGDENGIEYRGDDFFLEAGKDKDFGLLLKAAPYAIYKRGNTADWAQFNELFGIPFKKGKYSAQDEESRKTLEEALDKSGSAPWVVIPRETDVEIVTQATKGNGDLFNDFRKACNEEILVNILGQTMTTVQGSSRAQSETHKDVEEDVNKADRRFVQRILNTELLPRLEKRGFPVKGGWFTFPDAGESLSMVDQMKIHSSFIKDLGLEIDADFLYDFYGVPKPEGVATTKKEPDPDPLKKKKEKKKKLADSLAAAEISFFTRLRKGLASFFVVAPSVGASAVKDSALPTNLNLADLPTFDIEALAKRVAGGSGKFDADLFRFTSSHLVKALRAGFAEHNFSVGTDYGYTPDAYKTAMELNLFRFSASKDLKEMYELNQAFRESKGWSDFLSRAKALNVDFNETWLRTEYDTAYLTAESSALYKRLREQVDIFPYWQYITMDDGRVREEHYKLHQLILPANDPLWDKIWPPNGWRCRCRVKALMRHEVKGVDFDKERAKAEAYLKTDEWKKLEEQGWGVNRAKEAFVFAENQHYINKFPRYAHRYVKDITYRDFKLGTIEQNRGKAAIAVPVYTGSVEAWKAANIENMIITLTDYNDRRINILDDIFSSHTVKSRETRTRYLNALKETLATPDEVWLKENEKTKLLDELAFTKYYKDEAIVVIAAIEKGKYLVKTWFPFVEKPKSMSKKKLEKYWVRYRHGLLIKEKPGN
jgi:hypothetical protein